MQKKRIFGFSRRVGFSIIGILTALFIVSIISGALGQAIFHETSLSNLIAIEPPEIQLPGETVFNVGWFGVTNTLISSWVTMIVLVLLAVISTRKLKIVPGRLQNLVESAFEWMLNFCVEVAGEKNGRRFFPIITTIFLYVLVNAWMNLIPGYGTFWVRNFAGQEVHLFRGANTDINLALALALISFIFVLYYGIKTLGFSFFKVWFNFGKLIRGHRELFKGKIKRGFGDIFMGTIDAIVGLLEMVSYFFRNVSFTFRLFGNMTGGEVLILVIIYLVPWVLVVPFYGLELLLGAIQALVFAGLTLVFVSVATSGHELEQDYDTI